MAAAADDLRIHGARLIQTGLKRSPARTLDRERRAGFGNAILAQKGENGRSFFDTALKSKPCGERNRVKRFRSNVAYIHGDHAKPAALQKQVRYFQGLID